MGDPQTEALKYAIEAGNFEEAPALVSAYGNYATGKIRAASTPEERLAVAREALDFLHDRLHLARVMRAHLAVQLACVTKLSSYAISPADEHQWVLEG